MKQSFFLLAASLALVIFLTSCKRENAPEGQGGAGDIQIGVMLPLSGGAASLGKACLNGIQLATDEFNAGGGGQTFHVRLVVEDDQVKPTVGVSVFQKLATVDKVKAVIGPLASGVALAIAPLAESNHVVILSPGASTPALTTAGDYIFRNELSEEYGARAQAELAIKPLGFKAMALLYVNNEYGVGTVKVFKDRYLQLGGKVVADEAFAQGATDFRTALTRIKAANPDAIFVVFNDEIVNIAKQKSELAVPGTIYTTAIVEDAAILGGLGALANGIVYAHYGTFDNTAPSDSGGDFVKKYSTKFGEPPSYFAALGYDAGAILLRALKDAGGNADGIKDALYKIQKFPGVTGETSFDKNGDVTKPVILKVIKQGRPALYNP
jgi:branched-chain amino acid transport system substrate-binding protein